MATATEPNAATPAQTAPTHSGLPEGIPYRLTAAEYLRMVEHEIIPTDRRIGLWEGQLYEKMAKRLPHPVASSEVAVALIRGLPGGWSIWPENPILLNEFTAPIPDMTVVRGVADDYIRRGSNPVPVDIGLVIELADSSLTRDLLQSLQTYARAGLPVYWVVNLVKNRIEVYSQPRVEGDTARDTVSETFEPGKDVPLILDGQEVARIPARDLLLAETT
jgi:Uma2 family endonuclease